MILRQTRTPSDEVEAVATRGRSGPLLLRIVVLLLLLAPQAAYASGPQWVAGTSYFDPAAKGQPVVWAGGVVTYFIDQGILSSFVTHSQAVTLISKAAAIWNAVPTAAVSIASGGALSENVSGSNVTANSPPGTGAVLPADVQPSATTRPVGIIFDVDGTVINAIYGPNASDPSLCTQNGVFSQVDNMAAAGKITHALIIINGLCATTQAQLTLLQYELVRAFGRVLGLGWSQVNDAMFVRAATTTDGLTGWPVMHPFEYECTGQNYTCMPSELTLRLDDIAGLNRLYPVTSANASVYSTKQLTAAATFSVQGTIHFKHGQGMQGVNVTLTPLKSGVPDVRYQVSAVTGVSFHANAGNPIAVQADAQGNPLSRYGTDDPATEGFFDLSGVPLPTGTTTADYQLKFEPVNPIYVYNLQVGPYLVSQVSPSGTMPTLTVPQLSAGAAVTQDVTIADSADGIATDDGIESAPNAVAANGEWLSRLTGYGHTGWFTFPARANRVFTVEATSLDETGAPSLKKAGVMLGFWNAADPLGSQPDVPGTPPFNGAAVGLTTLNAQTSAYGQVRIAAADIRGDGRPDFLYRVRVLYADSVFPPRLTPSGGPIVIRGMGFRSNSQVTINGAAATVTSVTPSEITAVAPSASGSTGAVAVTVSDPVTLGTTSILDGLSYDAYGSDQIGVVAGPSGTISQGVPVPFTVRVLAADNVTPAANVAVSFSVIQGGATLGCGSSTCPVTTNGAGMATLAVTPTSGQATKVLASLASGASVLADFAGAPAPVIAAVTPSLYLAIGAQISWQPTALVLNGTSPVSGAGVTWAASSGGLGVQTSVSTTNQAGQASTTINVGPLGDGQAATFNACETQIPAACAAFTVNAVHAELATLQAISGTGQTLAASATPLPVVLAVQDAVGHPLAGATVNFYEVLTAWQPPCTGLGRCPVPQTLATQAVTATTNAAGTVTLTPLTGGGQPTNLLINATTGQQASLLISIEQHP